MNCILVFSCCFIFPLPLQSLSQPYHLSWGRPACPRLFDWLRCFKNHIYCSFLGAFLFDFYNLVNFLLGSIRPFILKYFCTISDVYMFTLLLWKLQLMGLWYIHRFVCDTQKELDELMNCLHLQGARESALKERLEKK